MSVNTWGIAGHRRTRRRRRVLVVVAAAVLTTSAVPATASAEPAKDAATLTATAPGSGSWVFGIENRGQSPITGFELGVSTPATNVVPSPACSFSSATGHIKCIVTVQPGAFTEMCYTGGALMELVPGGPPALVEGNEGGFLPVTTYQSSSTPCHVAGFNPGSSANTGSGSESKCVVPNVKGKKLAAAEKAITGAHCAVGKLKKARSKHVKKGSVISQSPGAGTSLSAGSKVGLVISKGR
jgi:hypothetical protein